MLTCRTAGVSQSLCPAARVADAGAGGLSVFASRERGRAHGLVVVATACERCGRVIVVVLCPDVLRVRRVLVGGHVAVRAVTEGRGDRSQASRIVTVNLRALANTRGESDEAKSRAFVCNVG